MNKYLLLFLLFSITSFSQKKTDKELIISLMGKAKKYSFNNNDSAIYYNLLAYQKSKEAKHDSLLAKICYNLSYHYSVKKDYETSDKYFNIACTKAHSAPNWEIIMLCKFKNGTKKVDTNLRKEALIDLESALKIAEEKDFKRYIVRIKMEIAFLYSEMRDTLTALKKNKAIIPFAKKHNKQSLIILYQDIGRYYINNNFDSATYYFKKGLKLSQKLNNKYSKTTFYNNLGYTYLTHKRYDSAIYFLNLGKKHASEYKQYPRLYYSNLHLGQLYNKKGNYSKSLNYYLTALNYEKEKEISSNQKYSTYKDIAQLYAELKQYDKAYEFQNKHQELKDSVFNIEKTNEFNKIRTEYEVENKNQEIGLLKSEKKIEVLRKKQLLFGAIALLFPLFLGLIFYRNRVKSQKLIQEKEKQRHEEEKQRLEKENQLEHANALIEGQDQERNRIAKEIHDGVGAQLAGLKLNLEQTNQTLQNNSIQKITHELENTFTELRSISHNLSLNYIREKELDTLLIDLKTQYEKNYNCLVELYIFPFNLLTQLPPDKKHHLYRIIQELLNNAQKHASATQIHISFTQHEDHINLIFEDNGKGFDVSLQKKGIGLQNIQERIVTLKGTLKIDSQLGRGTTFILDL